MREITHLSTELPGGKFTRVTRVIKASLNFRLCH